MTISSRRRVGAAALALAMALTFSPALLAAAPREREPRDIREKIVRVIKKIFGGITSHDDLEGPSPPKP